MSDKEKRRQDNILKAVLASLLPEKVGYKQQLIRGGEIWLHWLDTNLAIDDENLLLLCWMVEEKFTEDTDLAERYNIKLRLIVGTEMTLDYSEFYVLHATWQQRATALAKIKWIEIK